MEILQAALAALCIVAAASLLGGALLFRMACRRGKKPLDITGNSIYAPYLLQMEQGKNWFLAQKPQEAFLTAFDGTRLHAWVLPVEHAVGTVVLMHGYRADPLRDFSCAVEDYHTMGYNLILPHQRACGASGGSYVTFGALEQHDCAAWACFAARRFGIQLPLFLDGVSMGATTVLLATGLELPENTAGVIADCGFTSPWEIVGHVCKKVIFFRPIPCMWVAEGLARLRASFSLRQWDTRRVLQNCRLPVFFAHGTEDEFVPCTMSVEAHAACGSADKQLLLADGAAHGLSYLLQREEYLTRLRDFLARSALALKRQQDCDILNTK